MLLQAINAGMHVTAIVLLAGALCSEAFLFREGMREDDVKKLLRADLLHALATLAIFVTGSLRIAYFNEVPQSYVANPFFTLKLAIFFIVIACSLYPTATFYRWRRAIKLHKPSMFSYRQHRLVMLLIRLELAALMIIPMFVALSRMPPL